MKKKDKVYFVQRLGAYLIDALIVSVIAALISTFFINDSATKLMNKTVEISNSYMKQEIDSKTYIEQTKDLSYQYARQTCVATIIVIIVDIVYYMVMQFYLGGQTLGKRVLKIKIVKNDGSDLTMNDVVVRNLINNSIFTSIVVAVFVLFNKTTYFYGSTITSMIQYLITIISAFMIMFRKDGRSISDFIAGTKVVRVEE